MVTGPVFISEQLQLELQSKLNMGMGQNWLPEEISIVHIKNSTKPSVVPWVNFGPYIFPTHGLHLNH